MSAYRKRGSIVRYENGVLLFVREEGEAFDDGEVFRCAPIPATEPLPLMDPAEVISAVRRIEAIVQPPLVIERLVIGDGVAEHQWGERQWSESSRRLHLSVAHRDRRVLIDEGDFDLPALAEVLDVIARVEDQRSSPARLRLTPRVVAGLTSSLTHFLPPNLVLEQRAGGIDGYGEPIESSTGPNWPNWYRPSYRVRPRRVPMNVAVRCSVEVIEDSLPRAIALMAPVADLESLVLCVEGEEVFSTRVRVARVDAVTPPSRWYPFSAGVWAGEAEVVSAEE